ncbi:Arm DNA-binding domain-containing protein [Arhodomonas sp. SL1]|uniref:Arm DNA-binding domain-containing protein n=1 Tax=Arhodomonas sp. SL1 TaxID=3425691 RepID=UPI003F885E43
MSSIRRHHNGKLFFDFHYQGVRCREYTRLDDTPRNRRLMEEALKRIDAEITLGTFDYAKTFPNSKRASRFAKPATPGAGAETNAAQAPPQKELPTFDEFAEEWFVENEVTWKRSYRAKQRDILERYLKPAFGKEVVSGIRKSHVLKYRAQLAKVAPDTGKAASPSWINQVLNLLKQILDEAADRFDFSTPFRGIKPLRVGRTQIDPFSLEEVQRFLDALPPQWRPYFIVRFFTGMRTSEADGLKWQYVDFNRREIHIRETRVHGETQDPKTDGSARSIQMSGMVENALREQWRMTGQLSSYVFCSRLGYPLIYRNVNNRIWYPTLNKAGLRRRNPYQTRHTAATLWLAAGENPEWIARQMGHSNTKMLFTVYSRFVPNLTRQDGSAMERLLRSRLDTAHGASEEVDHAE